MTTSHIELWKDFHKQLLEIILPILLVSTTLYVIICLMIPIGIIFVSVFCFFIAGVIRESFWLSDYCTSKVIGYHSMMKILWSNIEDPPKRYTKIKMGVLFVFFPFPAMECRVRRLKRMYNKLEVKNR